MEHLRYLARASGIDDDSLVREAAYALASLPNDPSMLVIVCRRLVEKHELCAPLWWLCSSVLVSGSPRRAAWELLEQFEADESREELVGALGSQLTVAVTAWTESGAAIDAHRPDLSLTTDGAHADVLVVDAVAASPTAVLINCDSAHQIELAGDSTEVWLVCPTGTRLHDVVVAEIAERADSALCRIDLDAITAVVTTSGVVEVGRTGPGRTALVSAALRPDGPLAPELLRRSIG